MVFETTHVRFLTFSRFSKSKKRLFTVFLELLHTLYRTLLDVDANKKIKSRINTTFRIQFIIIQIILVLCVQNDFIYEVKS